MKAMRLIVHSVFVSSVLLCLAMGTKASATEPATIVEPLNAQADRAFKNGAHETWYDANEKALVFPAPESLQSSEDALKERHRLVEVNVPASNNQGSWWTYSGSFFEFLTGLFVYFMWGFIALLIVGVLTYLWFVLEPGWNRSSRRFSTSTDDTKRDQAKIVDLPFNIETPVQGLLAQAEASRQSGDYSLSIVYLFSYVLVELDEANCIRLQRGKTNRVYLRELKAEPRLAELHRYLMQVFEAIFFGRYSIDREICDRCWEMLPSILESVKDAKQRHAATTASTVLIPIPTLAPVAVSTNLVRIAVCMLGLVAGCGTKTQLPTDAYGNSKDSVSHKSISGLSVFREMLEVNGLRTFELKHLSQRAERLSVIIWAPKDFRVPSNEEIRWFDNWLSGDSNRLLVFVGRDYSPSAHYWELAADNAAPENRRTFRLRQGYAEVELEIARSLVEHESECEWLMQELTLGEPRNVERFSGPWAKGLRSEETNVVLRGSLKPNPKARTVETPELADDNLSVSEREFIDAELSSELDSTYRPIEYGPPKIKTLLKSDDGSPIISSISYTPWKTSRLVLIANGSLILNESLAMNGNQQLAERLANECASKGGRVGFLSRYGETFIRAPWDEQEPKGFELLRVWPLSLISIQGLFLGFIVLLALVPIFGRPQWLPTASTTDFGKHIEALGDLLLQSRDRNYALKCVATYFRDVRRDSASPWCNVAPPTIAPPTITSPTNPNPMPLGSDPSNSLSQNPNETSS
ncbi:MAG: DUF4129 domain-containing protein [Pirellulaceae bacterium]|nr:DUF4129 domain-containing protein [Pirellulaceae bacterium]